MLSVKFSSSLALVSRIFLRLDRDTWYKLHFPKDENAPFNAPLCAGGHPVGNFYSRAPRAYWTARQSLSPGRIINKAEDRAWRKEHFSRAGVSSPFSPAVRWRTTTTDERTVVREGWRSTEAPRRSLTPVRLPRSRLQPIAVRRGHTRVPAWSRCIYIYVRVLWEYGYLMRAGCVRCTRSPRSYPAGPRSRKFRMLHLRNNSGANFARKTLTRLQLRSAFSRKSVCD